MTYQYREGMGDIVLIDTHMFGFDRFQSCFLIKGPEIENLKSVRGETLYYYLKNELLASCAEAFSIYYQALR